MENSFGGDRAFIHSTPFSYKIHPRIDDDRIVNVSHPALYATITKLQDIDHILSFI